jgi:NAD(P)-dependent dehydrogenase (short-subunit alcohol dehydrogenase family)
VRRAETEDARQFGPSRHYRYSHDGWGRSISISKAAGTDVAAEKARMAKRHPLGRVGRDTDVANAVLFLASDAAAFMTGSEVVVDGGMTAT